MEPGGCRHGANLSWALPNRHRDADLHNSQVDIHVGDPAKDTGVGCPLAKRGGPITRLSCLCCRATEGISCLRRTPDHKRSERRSRHDSGGKGIGDRVVWWVTEGRHLLSGALDGC